MNSLPGVTRAQSIDLSLQGFGGTGNQALQFSVRGSNWDVLVALNTDLITWMNNTGVVQGISTDYIEGLPELQLTPDRARCDDAGITVDTGQRRQHAHRRQQPGQVLHARRPAHRHAPAPPQRAAQAARGHRQDPPPVGERDIIPLSSLVDKVRSRCCRPSTTRTASARSPSQANVAARHAQSDAIALVDRALKEVIGANPKYADCTLVLGGQSSQFSDAMSSLIFALAIGIPVAYMVLASQFNSFLHPVTVLTILPLSVAGALFGILVGGKTLNVFSMIGLLLLMGIVKKNSIILVDYALQMREQEKERGRARCCRRARSACGPILMTAVATLMSAVPSAMGLGPGAETRGPMADAVIGGLVLSTALSLLVVPAFYVVADGAKERLGRMRKKKPEEHPVAAHAGAGGHHAE